MGRKREFFEVRNHTASNQWAHTIETTVFVDENLPEEKAKEKAVEHAEQVSEERGDRLSVIKVTKALEETFEEKHSISAS
jgi:predicted RNA-binding protein with PUA-like domain